MELIKVKNGAALLNADTAARIAKFEREMKIIKEREDELKKAILEEMEAKNIIKVETDEVTITYIAKTDRETFDSKAFRAEHQDLYDMYVSMKPVRASIRIKVK